MRHSPRRTLRSCLLRRYSFTLAGVLVAVLLHSGSAAAQPLWQKMSSGIFGADIRALAIDSMGAAWAATGSGLYRFDMAERLWRRVSPIRLMAMAIRSNGTIHAEAADGGLMRSEDGGITWKSGPWNRSKRMMISPDGSLFGISHTTIVRSTDSGRSWRSIASVPPADAPTVNLCILSADTLFFTSYARTYRSTDNGDSWQAVTVPVPLLDMAPAGNGDLIATSHQGLYRSSDKGNTWLQAGPVLLWFIAPGHDGLVFGIEGGSSPAALLRSTNSGISWMSTTKRGVDIVVPGPGGEVWIVAGDSVFHSTDRGTSWEAEMRSDSTMPFTGSIARTPGGDLVVGSHGTIYHSSDNGESWSLRGGESAGAFAGIDSSGALYSWRESVEWFPGGDERTYLTLYRSSDGGDVWQPIGGGARRPVIDLTHPTILAASLSARAPMGGFRGGGVMLSSDGGRSWKQTALGLASHDVVVTPAGTVIAGVYEIEETEWIRRLYSSRDSGATWKLEIDSLETRAMSVAPNGTIYIWGRRHIWNDDMQSILSQYVMHRSRDDGRSWDTLFTDAGLAYIYIDPSSHVYLSLNEGYSNFRTLRSDDDGSSFRSLPQISPNANTHFFETLSGGDMIAAGGDTLHRWDATAERWRSIHANLPMARIDTAFHANGWLFVSTAEGLYRISLGTLGVEEPDMASGASMRIEPPRPHPVSTSTTIRMMLDAPMELRVTLSDLLGRELRLIHEGWTGVGGVELRFDREDLPAGVYLLRVEMPNGSMSRMIVVE